VNRKDPTFARVFVDTPGTSNPIAPEELLKNKTPNKPDLYAKSKYPVISSRNSGYEITI